MGWHGSLKQQQETLVEGRRIEIEGRGRERRRRNVVRLFVRVSVIHSNDSPFVMRRQRRRARAARVICNDRASQRRQMSQSHVLYLISSFKALDQRKGFLRHPCGHVSATGSATVAKTARRRRERQGEFFHLSRRARAHIVHSERARLAVNWNHSCGAVLYLRLRHSPPHCCRLPLLLPPLLLSLLWDDSYMVVDAMANMRSKCCSTKICAYSRPAFFVFHISV